MPADQPTPNATLLAAIPTVQPKLFDVHSADKTPIREFFHEHGFVVLSNVVSEEKRKNFVAQYAQNVLQQQPWKTTFPFRVIDPDTQAELDVCTQRDKYVSVLTSAPLDRGTIKRYADSGPLHKGFGAPCDHDGFVSQAQNEIRQEEAVYETASAILDNPHLWFDINRCIFKLPGEGEEEFIHLDTDPFKEYRPSKAVSGKVGITKMQFICAPKTHTEEFRARFKSAYREHYPRAKASAPKFTLDPHKPDPENIFAQCVAVDVPEGCMIFWSEDLFHGVRKSPIDSHIQIGMYLGFMPAVDRPEYLEVAGVSELEDRRRSYYEGLAPTLYPSLDEVHYYPKRFVNFHNILASYARKIPKGHPAVSTRIMKSTGRSVVHLVQTDTSSGRPRRLSTAIPYTPPPLTGLGRKLLGLDPWVV